MARTSLEQPIAAIMAARGTIDIFMTGKSWVTCYLSTIGKNDSSMLLKSYTNGAFQTLDSAVMYFLLNLVAQCGAILIHANDCWTFHHFISDMDSQGSLVYSN